MPPSIPDILKPYEHRPDLVQRIAVREHPAPVQVVPPDPAWPAVFRSVRARILAALGPAAVVAVHHTGSTSVPGLPAKDVIDVDLVVPDSADEPAYVARLEAAGFRFLLREPQWHQHRFFCAEAPRAVNLHVWSPDSPEVERHRIFRQRLLDCPEDREMYRRAKEVAALQTRIQGGAVIDYNLLKEATIRQILENAFEELGYR